MSKIKNNRLGAGGLHKRRTDLLRLIPIMPGRRARDLSKHLRGQARARLSSDLGYLCWVGLAESRRHGSRQPYYRRTVRGAVYLVRLEVARATLAMKNVAKVFTSRVGGAIGASREFNHQLDQVQAMAEPRNADDTPQA